MNLDNNIILFDGICKLCNAWARFVIKHDKKRIFKLAAMQSDAGHAILEKLRLPTKNFGSMIYIEDGRVYTKSEAFLKIVSIFSSPMKCLSVFKFIPRPLRDFIYDCIARNRYKLFGKYKQCVLPKEGEQDRFL